MEADLLNGSALAFVGDAAYETEIRLHVAHKGLTNPNDLHLACVPFVEAKGQAKIMKAWLHDLDCLTEQEIVYYKRGRNHKAQSKAKNATVGDYRQATGFEALLGWLYLTHQMERFKALVTSAIKIIEGESHEN